MSKKYAVALTLAGAMILGVAAPSYVAMTSHTPTESPWYRSFGSAAGSGDFAPGTWHINQDGMRYQVPYPCAYPIGADSGGAERFQMFGCPLD
jgi:hypothetical protein